MLKIKDNVDLKELEKYGFKPSYSLCDDETGEVTITHYYNTRRYNNRYGFCNLIPIKKKHSCIITTHDRTIENHLKCSSLKLEADDFMDLDIIYDLIKADLVEKVDD